MATKTVKVPAVKKKDGKVVKAPSKQYAHKDLETKGAVSYTHLTLPTIYSV